MASNMNIFTRHMLSKQFPVVFSHSDCWNVNIFQPAALYLKAFISRHPTWVENSDLLFWDQVWFHGKTNTPQKEGHFFPQWIPHTQSTPGMMISWIQCQILHARNYLAWMEPRKQNTDHL